MARTPIPAIPVRDHILGGWPTSQACAPHLDFEMWAATGPNGQDTKQYTVHLGEGPIAGCPIHALAFGA
jgi:hypothetical protein